MPMGIPAIVSHVGRFKVGFNVGWAVLDYESEEGDHITLYFEPAQARAIASGLVMAADLAEQQTAAEAAIEKAKSGE